MATELEGRQMGPTPRMDARIQTQWPVHIGWISASFR